MQQECWKTDIYADKTFFKEGSKEVSYTMQPILLLSV